MRLGVLEKAILSALYKKGMSDGTWECGRGGIEKRIRIACFLSDKKLSIKSFRRAIRRLEKKGLIQAVTMYGEPLSPGEVGYIFRPTEKGIKIAENLPEPGKIVWNAETKKKIKGIRKEMLQQIHEIANQLIEKQGYATASQIKQIAWEKYGNQYKNREEFEKIWSEDRIGRILGKLGFKPTRKGKKRERFWRTLPLKLPLVG